MKIIPTKRPAKPAKGDIVACQYYANYCAANSKNPKRALSSIWMSFIFASFLGSDKKELSV